ncbi:hypothetical protein MKW94_025462, partial [Papaver nudicaule]|nr:hypothetical protein [Papaver nudicaule]
EIQEKNNEVIIIIITAHLERIRTVGGKCIPAGKEPAENCKQQKRNLEKERNPMVDTPSPNKGPSSLERTSSDEASSTRSTTGLRKINRSRYPVQEDGVSDLNIECSGQTCKSCTATVVADCVAICCCPCAVLNFLTLTLVKVPFTMGRRCLRLMKKKKCILMEKKKERRRKGGGGKDSQAPPLHGGVIIDRVDKCSSKGGGMELVSLEGGNIEIPIGNVVNGGEHFCARVEAERVWLEFYQVGHLGFGRVSFTGIPPANNNNKSN